MILPTQRIRVCQRYLFDCFTFPMLSCGSQQGAHSTVAQAVRSTMILRVSGRQLTPAGTDLLVGLGLWQGSFEEVECLWLHWFDETGRRVPKA